MESLPSQLQREIKQTRPFRSTAQEATLAILRTADVLRRRVGEVVEAEGLTPQQYNVLRILRGSHPDPLSVSDVGERLIERTPGVTRLIDRLAEKELVRRARCADDRRMVHCWITEQGLAILARLDEPMDEADEALAGPLDEREVRHLVALLDRVRSGPLLA